jgi:hypothetical protein
MVAAAGGLALALAQRGAEAPNRVDYRGNTEPDVCYEAGGGIGPALCLTDAPPTATPDTRAQRARLMQNTPELVPIVEAAEAGDVARVIDLAVKLNLCEQEYRKPIERCADREYVGFVQQASVHSRPSLRTPETMSEWLTSLFDGEGSRLEYVARNESDDVHALVFRVSGPRCPWESNSCDYDKLVLYVVPGQEQPIDQFVFYIVDAGPPYEFWRYSGGLTNTYEVLLGDCDVTPNRECRD